MDDGEGYRQTMPPPRTSPDCGMTWRTNMRPASHALGALPDPASIRRQFTLDADAVHDVAHGTRMLFRTPGFTAIALFMFAIGIGATTAIVSVADALLMCRCGPRLRSGGRLLCAGAARGPGAPGGRVAVRLT
jgi:hypothetical protein